MSTRKSLKIASTPQDGKIPTRLFYNRPYDKPDIFIKDKQMIEDSKTRFKGLTGIDLASVLTPKDFGPMELYGIPHIRTRSIRDFEMKHFRDFIRNTGGGEFPRVQRKDNLKIASLADGQPDSSIMNYVTEKGFFLDGQGKGYMQQGGKFYDAGEYNPDIHGLPVPLVKNRSKLKIA